MSKTEESKTYLTPRIVKRIRWSRKWHGKLSLLLAVLLFVSAFTGLLLAWKKESQWLQPSTQKGSKGELSEWKSIAEISKAAQIAFIQEVGPKHDSSIDRMDIRPKKNTVKVRFKHDNYEIQLDGITADILSVGKRNADWIERIHDGSIVSDLFKLISMNVLSILIFIMIFTGLWLRYGPKRYRALRQRQS